MDSLIHIGPERPDHPDVMAMLEALDSYLATLYEPEANHILSVDQLLVPEVRFLVARQGRQIVGCGATRRMPAEAETDDHAYGEIKRMFVRPEARGQRIAERLLGALEAGLIDDGITQALLETGGEQTEAVRLYERCGYRRRGPFGGYPDNGLSWFYAKDLQP